MGGEAVVNGDDVSDGEGAQRLVNQAIETFGTLDVLINDAGILRDRMLVTMTIEEWDAVMRVRPARHVRPHAVGRRLLAGAGEGGETVDARIIDTPSSSGIYGNVGQTNYGAAKAGISGSPTSPRWWCGWLRPGRRW